MDTDLSSRHVKQQISESLNETKYFFTDESSSEDETRIRTNSGSFIPKSVKRITDFFDQKADVGSVLVKSIDSQGFKAKTSQPRKSKKVNRSTVKKLKSHAKHLSVKKNKDYNSVQSQASLNTNPNTADNPDNRDCLASDTDQSFSSDCFSTPTELNKSEETNFLVTLSKQLKMASKEQLQAMGVNADDTEASNNSAEDGSNINYEIMDAQSSNQIPREGVSMEVTDSGDQNPEVMGVASVITMFNKLSSEMKKGLDDLNKKVEVLQQSEKPEVSAEVIEHCKQQITESMDISVQKDKEEILKLKKELKYFKFRNRTLTNVVDDLNTEMEEMRNRIDNLELNSCRNAVTITGLLS